MRAGAFRQHVQRLRRRDGDSLRLIETANHRGRGMERSGHITDKSVIEPTRVGRITEIKSDAPRGNFISFKRPANRIGQHARAGGKRLGQNQVIELFVHCPSQMSAIDVERDLPAGSDRQLRQVVAKRGVASGENVEASRNRFAVQHACGRLIRALNGPIVGRRHQSMGRDESGQDRAIAESRPSLQIEIDPLGTPLNEHRCRNFQPAARILRRIDRQLLEQMVIHVDRQGVFLVRCFHLPIPARQRRDHDPIGLFRQPMRTDAGCQ